MKNRKKWNGLVRAAKIVMFALMLAVMGFIGLLWFLRPEMSTLEKRTLIEFPELTWDSFWDGSFFTGIETWYSDTYPLRESLIAGNKSMENLYGIRTDQLIGDTTQVADEIPDPDSVTTAETKEEEPEEAQEEILEDGTVTDIGEMAGTIYITNNTGYEIYSFVQSGADNFASTMNAVYERVKEKVNLYVLVAPLGSSVCLDESVLEDMGSSDATKAIEYVYAQLDEGIHAISASENLRKHNSEYIYFATDHHWTQLGAYYAYQEFCEVRGFEANSLDEFETIQFDNFLGTFYSFSNQSPALADNPDTIYAYIPMATNEMKMTMSDGITYNWKIVNDVSDYPSSELYATYVGGDNPISYTHNENITDGSAIMVVKDSYGNAFIPWLVDHYEYVYWVDFRYTSNTISQMVADYGVDDVLYLCNIHNMTGSSAISAFNRIGY